VKPDATTEGGVGPKHKQFATTHWSVVLACADSGDEAKARRALSELCKTYWRPIFAFICQQGHSVPDAQDLTQDFFLMVLEGHLLERADPHRGRFRSLLLKAVKDFLADAVGKKRALKRGGNRQFVSWDEWAAEAPSHLAIPAEAAERWSAEKIYDVRWAATVVERAMRRLGDECESGGRRRVFDALSGFLTADRADVSYVDLARRLGIEQTALKKLLYQMRQRYRALLREEVGQTVEKPSDVDDELRYLCAALAAAEG
jgi:DNA-directed RNA polymerase specialized sigma24 family protein